LLLPSQSVRSDTIENLQGDADRWVSGAKELYRLDCDALHKIHEAYCGLLDPVGKGEHDEHFARDIALALQENEKGKIQPLLASYDGSSGLKARAEELEKDNSARSQAESILKKIEEQHVKLERLQNDGVVLQGSNHPYIQYAIEYGKQMHKEGCRRVQGAFVCDKGYPEAEGRPDCVAVNSDGLWVYEFKPNNQKAIDEGETQLDRYMPAVQKYYQAFFKKGRHGGFEDTPDSDHGGKEILLAIDAQDKCWDGDKLKVRGVVDPYPMCDQKWKCEED
jgi:hypothetical protein